MEASPRRGHTRQPCRPPLVVAGIEAAEIYMPVHAVLMLVVAMPTSSMGQASPDARDRNDDLDG
jgi:hypothetical protein